ncbi:MAG: hypothetical protein HQL66_13935 [Magnetococcales bacterium]|nr:hypothetical protein [Magnetococcales bacterium]
MTRIQSERGESMEMQIPSLPFVNPAASRLYQTTQGGIRPTVDGVDGRVAAVGVAGRDRVTLSGRAGGGDAAGTQSAEQSLATILHTRLPAAGKSAPTTIPRRVDIMV